MNMPVGEGPPQRGRHRKSLDVPQPGIESGGKHRKNLEEVVPESPRSKLLKFAFRRGVKHSDSTRPETPRSPSRTKTLVQSGTADFDFDKLPIPQGGVLVDQYYVPTMP